MGQVSGKGGAEFKALVTEFCFSVFFLLPNRPKLRFQPRGRLQGHRAGLQSLLTESAQPRPLELGHRQAGTHRYMCHVPAVGSVFFSFFRLKLALGFPDLVLFRVEQREKATRASSVPSLSTWKCRKPLSYAERLEL